MPRRDFVTSLVLIALGTFVSVASFRMPRMSEDIYTAPGLVPGLLGIALIIFGVRLLVRSARAGGARLLGGEPGASVGEAGERNQLSLFGAALAMILIYAAVLVGWIAFWLATLLFVFSFIAFFEWQPNLSAKARGIRLGTALVQAILVAAAVSFLFERVFRIHLP